MQRFSSLINGEFILGYSRNHTTIIEPANNQVIDDIVSGQNMTITLK